MDSDPVIQMYSFYIVRGHDLHDLESKDPIEKRFYIKAMEEYYKEQNKMFGG